MNFKKLAAALAVVGLITTAIAGPAMAAAPTLDTESTDTTETTTIDGTYTQTYNTTTTSNLSWSADSNATAVEVRQGADGRLLATYDNDSSVLTFDGSNSTSGEYYWSAEFADDAAQYPGIEAGAGESITVEARLINDSTMDNPDTTNVSYTFSNGANVSFANMNNSETKVSDATSGGVLSFTSSLSAVNVFSEDNDSEAGAAEVVDEKIGVNGDSQETVTVHVANSDAQDSMAAVYTATEGSDAFSTVAIANFGGEAIPVFAAGQDVPDWFDEDMTYATVSEDGSTVTVENAGEALSEDDTDAKFSMTANDAIGFGNARDLASSYGAGTIESLSLGVDALDFNGSPELAEV